jgi:hypothetical protein
MEDDPWWRTWAVAQSASQKPNSLSPVKAGGSGDLLSCSPVHAGAQDEVDYDGDASSERQNLDWFQVRAAVAGQEFI